MSSRECALTDIAGGTQPRYNYTHAFFREVRNGLGTTVDARGNKAELGSVF